MGRELFGLDVRAALVREINRRRLLAGMGLAAAALAAPVRPAGAAQSATPAADQAQLDRLTALSKSLCGGGSFDANQAALLHQLLSGDASLSRGLAELYAANPATPAAAGTPVQEATPVARRSQEAQAAAEAILLFWYGGTFNGQPIDNLAAAYPNLLAWQAMYTPAWATCKVFGAWADAPLTTPQVPENA